MAPTSPTSTLAISLPEVGFWLITLIGMAALGTVVWKLLQRQERKDSGFQAKLDADDERADRNQRS